MIRFLEQEEKERSRSLYEEAFEDPEKFVDYYYREQAPKNRILVKEESGEIRGMMHLVRRFVCWEGMPYPVDYIYAVATKKEYRRQGYMRELMEEALHIMNQEKSPFTYLIPTKEQYYEGFGFRSVGTRFDKAPYDDLSSWEFTVHRAYPGQEQFLMDLSLRMTQDYQLYTFRTDQYYRERFLQAEAEDRWYEVVYDGRKAVGIRLAGYEDGKRYIFEELFFPFYRRVCRQKPTAHGAMVKKLDRVLPHRVDQARSVLILEEY